MDACHNGICYIILNSTRISDQSKCSLALCFHTFTLYWHNVQCTYRVLGVLSIISPQFSGYHCWPIYWLTFPCCKYVRDFKRARKITVYMKHAVFPLQVWLCVCGFFVVTLDRSFVRSSHTISHPFVLSI